MEAVDVLVGIDGEQGRELVEALRQRELNEVGVDLGIGVEAGDDLVQLLLGGVLGQFGADRADADLLAVLVLEADVGRAGGVLAHEDGSQAGRDAHLRQRRHLLGQLGPHGGSDGGSVENCRAHPSS